uniref:Protein SZT2 n=2 Tax=Schistocephalus solidus TaxID=70667 RepID=A0A0X3NS30_SCHSO
MFQPSSSGYCPLHHATTSIETTLRRLIPENCNLELPLRQAYLKKLSLFISIIGVVPGRQSFTIIHDWEAEKAGLGAVMYTVAQKLFHLEATEELLKPQSTQLDRTASMRSALVDLLRHGVLTLAMQKPDWAPASLVIISDGCLDTYDMVELDRSLAHLRAEAIRCCFIVLFPYDYQSEAWSAELPAPRGLLLALSSGPCVAQYDLCRFIAHATAGFCLANPSQRWKSLREAPDSSSTWNSVHELFLALKLQDDASSDPSKEGDQSWTPLEEIRPFSRVVHASITHVLASRLKDGYRLRSASVFVHGTQASTAPSHKNGPKSEVGMEKLAHQNKVPVTRNPYVQLELVLAWKPGVIFNYFLCGEWYLPIGNLPILRQPSVLPSLVRPPQMGISLPHQHAHYHRRRHLLGLPHQESPESNAPYCVANLRVLASYSFIHGVTNDWKRSPRNNYRRSVLDRFAFHLRLLNHVDDYLEKVSSFNLNPSIYTVPSQYVNGISPVFLTVQAQGGNLEIHLAGNLTEDPAREQPGKSASLSCFASYWKSLLSLDIANCYRWMHTDTIYILLEHDSPLPQNLFIPVSGRRSMDTLSFRQSLSRIHSMFSEWSSFVLLENHTYIRFESPPSTDTLSVSNNDLSKDSTLLEPSDPSVPSYFTLVRLEMKLPEIRVRIAFAAGIPSDLRRVTLQHLSEQLQSLSFPPRGKQAVPKSRHKSGNFHHLYDAELHVPPLQRSWAETPCCIVIRSRLDRLVVETGTYCNTKVRAIHSSTTEQSSIRNGGSQLIKCAVSEVRCDVSPSLLRQHLYHTARIWVLPLHSKSINCLQKIFSTLMNLRIQEGFHFVRSGPLPGFISLVKEILFTTDSVNSDAQPCLVQYHLYPFHPRSCRTFLLDSDKENSDAIQRAAQDVQRLLDTMLPAVPPTVLSRLKYLTASHQSSDFQIVSEVWIEPKHGRAFGLSREADYLAHLSYKQVAQRMLQLDSVCLSAYFTLESLLNACLLKIIRLQRASGGAVGNKTPSKHSLVEEPAEKIPKKTYDGPVKGTTDSVTPVPFNLTNLIAVAPQLCLVYPLPINPALTSMDEGKLNYMATENLLVRLFLNLGQRMPHIAAIPMTTADSEAFDKFMISSQPSSSQDTLRHFLKNSPIPEWQCFAIVFGPQGPVDSLDREGVDLKSVTVALFFLPANLDSAVSTFTQALITTLQPSAQFSPGSLPIFVFSCSHTYLSFLLDDRWTYTRPMRVVIDSLLHPNSKDAGSMEDRGGSLFFTYESLPMRAPQTLLDAAKGNTRLTQELVSLWRCLRETTILLMGLCDESFVETIHRALDQGFPLSDNVLRMVLVSDRFCSSLRPIKIDATDFLCATCSHCFNAVKRCQTEDDSFSLDSKGRVFARNASVSCQSTKSMQCGLRINDHPRIQARLASVINQFFAPVPRFPGFYFFRLAGYADVPTVCDELSGVLRALNLATETTYKPRFSKNSGLPHVVFSASSVSDEDAQDASHPNSPVQSAQPCILLTTKPLFLKLVVHLSYCGSSIKLPAEDLPFCLLDLIPSLSELIDTHKDNTVLSEVRLEDIRLEVVFIPRVWRPNSISMSDGAADKLQDGDQFSKANFSTVEEEDENEQETSEYTSPESQCSSASDTHLASAEGNISSGLATSYRTSDKIGTDEEPDFNEFPFAPYLCDCIIDPSVDWEPVCDLCRALICDDTIRYLNMEQRSALQQTVLIFRWLLKDEVICSLRLLHPVSQRALELVLQHMETTNMLLVNSAPVVGPVMRTPQVLKSGQAVPLLPHQELPQSFNFRRMAEFDALEELTAGIKSDSVNLLFVVNTDKAMPKFINKMESISFRSSRGKLVRLNDYYVVCSLMPPKEKSFTFDFRQPSMESCQTCEEADSPTRPHVMKKSDLATALYRSRSDGKLYEPENQLSQQMLGLSCGANICCNAVKQGADVLSTFSSTPQRNLDFSPDAGYSFHVSGQAGYDGDSSATESENFEPLAVKPPVSTPLTSLHEQRSVSIDLTCMKNPQFCSSSFPPQKADKRCLVHLKRRSFSSRLAYWLIFRVGSSSVTAYFHHSDTHCERGPLGSSGSDCLYCPVFQKAIKDLQDAVTFVNRTLLLDQLSTERMCDPLLLPGDTDEGGNACRLCPIDSFLNPKARRVTPKHFIPSQRSPCATDPLMSASSTTDTDSAAVSMQVGQRLHQRIVSPTSLPSNKHKRLQTYQDTKLTTTEVGPTYNQVKAMNMVPGMFACPTQFVIRIEIHPRASSGGERGHRVLPELRRLLENFAVLNRANMFFLIDSQEARAEHSVNTNLTASSARARRTNNQKLVSSFTATSLCTTGPKRRATTIGTSCSSVNFSSSQNRTFYMLLKEVTDSTGECSLFHGGIPNGQPCSPPGGHILRRESLPANLILIDRPHPVCPPAFAPATNLPTGTRTILQATLHGISAPSRHLYASVRQLLQTQLDKIVLQRLSEALSRNALNRLTLSDLDFFFSRCWDHPHLRLVTHLPDLFGHSVAHLDIPTGALVLAFSQYLKQNLLLFTHQVKPERELAAFLRERLGCGELLLYNRPRGLGVAKSGIAAVLVNIEETRQTSEMKPHKIRFFIEPHEWLHLALANSAEAFTFDELCSFLSHLQFSSDNKTPTEGKENVARSKGSHLVVKFQIWERGEANVSHLIDRLKSAVRHAVFDLITEYLILTQPLTTVEVPIFKTRSAGPPPVEALSRQTVVNPCASSRFLSSYLLSSNSIQMSSYFANVLTPWLEVARALETPLVTIKNFILHSDLSIRFLVSELVSQLNLLVEEANGAFGGVHMTKCPVLSAMMSSPSARSIDPQSRVTARSPSNCPQPPCSCLRSIHFFAFQSESSTENSLRCRVSNVEENSVSGPWTTFSVGPTDTADSVPTKLTPGQRRDYLIIGRNYSICKLQSTLDVMYHNLQARSGQRRPSPPASAEEPGKRFAKVALPDPSSLPRGFVRARPVSTCPGRVPLQRQQPLEIQMQVLLERTAAAHGREHSADPIKERPPTTNSLHENSRIASDPTSTVSTSHGSLNNLCDLPEFCEIQLCLPEDRLPSPATTSLSSPATDDPETPSKSESPLGGGSGHCRSPVVSMCIPRQAVCLIRIKGRVLTVYTYNWLRDELDRLMGRVETLVDWYNQRFQLLECLSTQKMGLFHNLRGSRYRPLLQRMSELSRFTCSPELSPRVSTSESTNGVSGPSASAAVVGAAASVPAAGSIAARRRTTAVTPQTVPGVTSFTRSNPFPQAADYQVQEAANQQRNPDCNQTCLIRIFQDCAHVPALQPLTASHPPPVDLVHNHALQALETVERDRQRAHHLLQITAPLELWFGGGNSAGSSISMGDSAESLSPSHFFPSGLSDDARGRFKKDDCAADGGAAEDLFSAVKGISRTLHTVCAPVLLAPAALAEALRVQAQEQAAEVNYALLQQQQLFVQEQEIESHADVTSDEALAAVGQPVHSGSVAGTTGSLTMTGSTWTAEATDAGASFFGSAPHRRRKRSLRLFTVAFKDEPPIGRPQSYSIPGGELDPGYPPAVSLSSTLSVQAGHRRQRLRKPSIPTPRSVPTTTALGDATQTISNPLWLIEASNTLVFEYVQYLTSQVHFSVIRSSLWDNSKSPRPYALLQRSIQMAGVHLIEVFVRDHLFCVRLRAVELWRFSSRASRALMTGPLSTSILGQAAATAAATIASAIMAVDRSTASFSSLTGGVLNGSAVGQTQVESAAVLRGLSSPQALHHQHQQSGFALNKAAKCSLKMLAETSKWEESSRLCDCTHLHSFLYDFYLRHVDAYLRSHSDLVGQRESPSLLFKSLNSTTTGDLSGGLSFSRPHSFLPNGFAVLQFLEQLELLSRTPPVFARGTFGRIRLAVSIGTRIKPEQVFDHLIDERHVYGLRAFEVGARKTGGSTAAHHRLGICAFSDHQQPQHANAQQSLKPLLLVPNRRPGQPVPTQFGRHLLRGDSKSELMPSATSPVVISESSLSEEAEEDEEEKEQEEAPEKGGKQENAMDKVGKDLESKMEIEEEGVLAPLERGSNPVAASAVRCLPRFKLPPTSFSVASVVFFDAAQSQLLSQQQKPQDSSNDSGPVNSYMNLSIFILLTDQQKRYPRTRLSSLPEGLPSKHTAPVHWPAIRPSFSFHSDLSQLPALQRSGSQESTTSIVNDTDNKFSNFMLPRIRHSSLMIRTKQETSEIENQLQRYSLNMQDVRRKQPTLADPGLRWKISYLGVWPSHQINLSRAFTRISNAWRKAIPEIVNLAILNCHKNFLWYRLFDPKYFPLQCCFETRDLEQGEDIVASQSNVKPLQTNVHRGLTLEEFKDLIGSAPQHSDLLRMDQRLTELLEVGCEHLTDMVTSINALWQASTSNNGGGGVSGVGGGSEKLVAFLYEEPEMAPAALAGTCWRMHLGLIAPSIPEGLVLLRWTEVRDIERVPQPQQPPSQPSPSLGASIRGASMSPSTEATLRALSHRYLPTPVEGTSLDCDAPGRHKCSNFSMKAIFRSANTAGMINSRSGILPVSASGQKMQDMANQRSYLLPILKKLVEHLSFFVWKDLH